MKELKKKPTSDIRIEALLGFYDDLANKPGRKRDRLYQAVLKMIERGFWNPGDRLPTDADFAHLLPLSVATVQAALKMLSDQKVIVRKQKQGSFVASEDNLNRDIVFLRFRHREDGRSETVDFKSIEVTETLSPGPGSRFFGDNGPLLKVSRDLEVSGEFMVHSDIYLADPRLRILLDLDPEMIKDVAIRTLLQTRFGLPSVRFDWQIATGKFSDDICAKLNVASGTIGQIADVEVYTINDQKLMLHRLWIPPSDWALRISS